MATNLESPHKPIAPYSTLVYGILGSYYDGNMQHLTFRSNIGTLCDRTVLITITLHSCPYSTTKRVNSCIYVIYIAQGIVLTWKSSTLPTLIVPNPLLLSALRIISTWLRNAPIIPISVAFKFNSFCDTKL